MRLYLLWSSATPSKAVFSDTVLPYTHTQTNSSIQYKVAVAVCKILTTQELSYLTDVIRFHVPSRHLYSCNRNLLQKDHTNLVFTDRSLSQAAPTASNNLPQHVISDHSNLTSFKRLRKSELAILHSVNDSTCVNNRIIIIIIHSVLEESTTDQIIGAAVIKIHFKIWLQWNPQLSLKFNFNNPECCSSAVIQWQWSILGVCWKEWLTTAGVRVTEKQSMKDIFGERRLQWLGHVIQTYHQCVSQQPCDNRCLPAA